MTTNLSVPIPTSQFLELADFLRSNSDPRDPVEVVSVAVDYWIENASWKPELLAESDARGYQWKNLFLPEGTQIRMQYKGAYSYAKVEGDEIIYQGKTISAGSLANSIAGSNRNAWRDLWIKRPWRQGMETGWRLPHGIEGTQRQALARDRRAWQVH
jgi:hypothetical protein